MVNANLVLLKYFQLSIFMLEKNIQEEYSTT